MPITLVLPFCNPLNSSVDKRDGGEGGLARLYAVGFVRDGSAFLSMIAIGQSLKAIWRPGAAVARSSRRTGWRGCQSLDRACDRCFQRWAMNFPAAAKLVRNAGSDLPRP